MDVNWKSFEEECVMYLRDKYGENFELKGGSDAMVSDICFDSGFERFYIEAKLPNAQCGQFVLFPDFSNRIFKYSHRNKTKENQYSKKIVDFMSRNFEDFCYSGTTGTNIEMDKTIFYDWIINYYREKKVEFLITKDKEKFIIFPINKISKYFNVIAKYREKKSGSSSFNNANKYDLESAMKLAGIEYYFLGLELVCDEDIDKRLINGQKYDYFFRKDQNTYKIRKLSNTRNANVIFSITLIPYDKEEQKIDIIDFENKIKSYLGR